jgi:hypothetical protein
VRGLAALCSQGRNFALKVGDATVAVARKFGRDGVARSLASAVHAAHHQHHHRGAHEQESQKEESVHVRNLLVISG